MTNDYLTIDRGGLRMRGIHAAGSLALIALALPAAAHAQNADGAAVSAAPAETADQGSDQSGEPGIADIVVTAQRRDQRLQDVPVSVTAFGEDDLAARGIVTTQDLNQVVTGATFSTAVGYVQPFIRGIGSLTTNLGEQGSTATYIDGVYLPTVLGQIFDLPNVASVEVLKGPQGTLFGRNANSGAVLISTKQPGDELELSGELGIGNYDAVSVKAFASGPLSDKVGVALSGSYFRQDGWFNDLFRGGGRRLGETNRYNIRATLVLRPVEDLTITLGADQMHLDDPTVVFIRPGKTGYLGLQPGGLMPQSPYDIISNERLGYQAKQRGLSAKIAYDFGNVTLTSTTAYRTYRSKGDVYDSDGTPIRYVALGQTDRGESLTQEIQLTGETADVFNWVAGGFYMRQVSRYDPLLLQIGATPLRTITARQVTEALAAFVDGTFTLGDFEITGGLRYSREDKSYDGQLNGAPVVTDAAFNQDAFTPRVVLSYHPGRDLLAYASFSRGFKAGAFNVAGFSRVPVKSETIDAYEVGLKLTPSPRVTVNLAGFFYDSKDLQVQALNPTNNLIELQNAAAVRSKGIDLDVNLRPAGGLTVNLGLSYLDSKVRSFPNAQVYIPAGGPGAGFTSVIRDVSGNRNVRSPKFTGTFYAGYDIDLPSGGKITPAVNVYATSHFFWEFGNRMVQDGYVLVNPQIAWELPGGRYTLTLWANNIGNVKHDRVGLPSGQTDRYAADAPRTYGIRVKASF